MFSWGKIVICKGKSKGKATNFLTGYNMRSDEDRKNYDESKMCKSYGIKMMVMAVPFIVGAVIDYIAPGIGSLIAWGCWIVLFVLLLFDRSKREKRC
jgi:FtsH-binding integral membrane protein